MSAPKVCKLPLDKLMFVARTLKAAEDHAAETHSTALWIDLARAQSILSVWLHVEINVEVTAPIEQPAPTEVPA